MKSSVKLRLRVVREEWEIRLLATKETVVLRQGIKNLRRFHSED